MTRKKAGTSILGLSITGSTYGQDRGIYSVSILLLTVGEFQTILS